MPLQLKIKCPSLYINQALLSNSFIPNINLCLLLPSPSICLYFLISGYLLQTPDNSNFFDFPRRFELSEVAFTQAIGSRPYLHIWNMKPTCDTYIYIVLHTYIRLFKAFKNKDKYFQRMPWKGSLRGWPYGKKTQKKNLKNILILKVHIHLDRLFRRREEAVFVFNFSSCRILPITRNFSLESLRRVWPSGKDCSPSSVLKRRWRCFF